MVLKPFLYASFLAGMICTTIGCSDSGEPTKKMDAPSAKPDGKPPTPPPIPPAPKPGTPKP
jgi:hypothetical protein